MTTRTFPDMPAFERQLKDIGNRINGFIEAETNSNGDQKSLHFSFISLQRQVLKGLCGKLSLSMVGVV